MQARSIAVPCTTVQFHNDLQERGEGSPERHRGVAQGGQIDVSKLDNLQLHEMQRSRMNTISAGASRNYSGLLGISDQLRLLSGSDPPWQNQPRIERGPHNLQIR